MMTELLVLTSNRSIHHTDKTRQNDIIIARIVALVIMIDNTVMVTGHSPLTLLLDKTFWFLRTFKVSNCLWFTITLVNYFVVHLTRRLLGRKLNWGRKTTLLLLIIDTEIHLLRWS